ncbi:MAG: type I DNA topoisomerase [Alphaproteobacteria bacterium]|nr:type I DNA topoisomerase [Alphaproteobacteria bacterium]
MSAVVVVESPAKSKTINRYLGKDYQVLASFGHVRDLPSKDGSVRPDDDFAMDYEVSSQSHKHIAAIEKAVKNADTVYLATDPDREGEAIAWHVVEVLKQHKALKAGVDVKRISFNEITKSAILQAIKQPRDIDMDLVNAQQARRALDYLVGFNLSPVLWKKLPGSKSAGRVQSVALRLIVEREEEIEQFITQEYWTIKALLTTKDGKEFTASLATLQGEKVEKFTFTDEASATKALAVLEGCQFTVSDIEKKQLRRNPPPPFTTATLQQEASKKLGFGASRTMQLAQRLYEGIDMDGEATGLITYMRTDGVTVSKEAIDATRTMVLQEFGKSYVPAEPRIYKTKAKNAQEAHEAIRPTDVTRKPKEVATYLDDAQYKLYELIWNRMVASQMQSAVMDQVIVLMNDKQGKAVLKAVGTTIAFDGFLALYQEGQEDDSKDEQDALLPPLHLNDDVNVQDWLKDQHFTQPPGRYSEAGLVKKMEELGIGRPSTYASIISVLQDREYVVLDKRRFIPEERGRLVTAFLKSYFGPYVEYNFTAELENALDDISAGEMAWKEVLRGFWKPFKGTIDEVQGHDLTEILDVLNEKLTPHLFQKKEDGSYDRHCPVCNKGELHLRIGKFGAFLGCNNYPECNNTRPLQGHTSEEGEQGGAGAQSLLEGPRLIGKDPATGMDVTVRKGPYGHYLQVGEALKSKDKEKAKPKRVSLPKGYSPDSIDLATALAVLSLPREVGTHPETGKKIVAGIGRFGPYLQHDSKYVTLKTDDVLTVGINRAVDLIAESAKGGAGGKAEPLRVIGKHPDSLEDIAVYKGRYGPYIKYNGDNITLPKNTGPEQITLEQALLLIETKQSAPKKKVVRKKKTK